MALSGFLVPFATGALIRRQEIADQYDENAGKIIDAASEQYKDKFNLNSELIELQNQNYAAVEEALGTGVAEVAAKQGLLEGIKPHLVVGHVEDSLGKGKLKAITDITKDLSTADLKNKLQYQSLFSEDYTQATKSLEGQRDWAANNFNKGAIKNVTDMFLGKEDEEPSPVKKTQEFLFGDKITPATGAIFEQAAAKEIGETITVQPKAVSDLKASIADVIGYQEPKFIGTIREVDQAIATELSIPKAGATITNEGLLFAARYNVHANGIRHVASNYDAVDYTNEKGQINVAALIANANNELIKTAIDPVVLAFEGYDNGPMNYKGLTAFSKRVMVGGKLSDEFTKRNDITLGADDVKQTTAIEGKGAVTEYSVSDKVYQAFVAEINTLPSIELQAVYIDYLPDNYSTMVNGRPANIKERLEARFRVRIF